MRSPDVIVVGGGVIGLSIAVEAARRGLIVTVFEAGLPWGSVPGCSRAQCAYLADGAARGNRCVYRRPGTWLSGVSRPAGRVGNARVPIGWGVLEVIGARDGAGSAPKHRASEGGGLPPGVTVLGPGEVRELEPELAAPSGALLHSLDGWLDPRVLVDALGLAAGELGTVRRVATVVHAIDRRASGIGVHVGGGEVHRAPTVVLAAGAWSPRVAGTPTPIPVEPARGQLLAFEGTSTLRHAVAFDDGYIVPRETGVIVGSTMEHVGFDPTTTSEGLQGLEDGARRVIPGIVTGATGRQGWAGLRPVTPDLLPIIDRDPEWARLIYACGHSKNGVLLAPRTAQAVVAMLVGEIPAMDMRAFGLGRFRR